MRWLALMIVLAVGSASFHAAADGPVIEIDRDNVEIRTSARLVITDDPIVDADGSGVIHIVGDDLTVELVGQHLRGAETGAEPDEYRGIGIRVTGSNVTVTGGRVSGFKAAVHATGAEGLTIDGMDVSDNFRQRLKSTPQAEDSSDWLWPHRNDDNEWLTNYGAGIYIEDAEGVTVRNVRARDGQNGIILDRVNDSRVYDNDCSFLSGWGLAMWRSNGNTISRNAFDFCVRGYSHGVYNRGQDSAGILMFEQCSDNIVAENSATHGGDGVFAFAGKEALGETSPREDLAWYERRGNNRNVFIDNDLSYAAAHGLELTFSFDNLIARNRLVGNAICGIWGGFSQDTYIALNAIEENGDMPYGRERGGINIEDGHANAIQENIFRKNACGVRFWQGDHRRLLELPWAKVNHQGSSENVVAFNNFHFHPVAIEIRNSTGTHVGRNVFEYDPDQTLVDIDEPSEQSYQRVRSREQHARDIPEMNVPGDTHPVGAREALRGRDRIIMTEWGPYDWQAPLLSRRTIEPTRHVYKLFGDAPAESHRIDIDGRTVAESDGDVRTFEVTTETRGRVQPYRIEVSAEGASLRADGVLVPATWHLRFFESSVDPREDVEVWRQAAEDTESTVAEAELNALNLRFDHGGPVDVLSLEESLPADHFGTIATTTLTFPAGRWRVRTVSDDGIRVWMDEAIVIDDWTQHPPKTHVHEFALAEERAIDLRVEHFEIDGFAVLSLEIEHVAD